MLSIELVLLLVIDNSTGRLVIKQKTSVYIVETILTCIKIVHIVPSAVTTRIPLQTVGLKPTIVSNPPDTDVTTPLPVLVLVPDRMLLSSLAYHTLELPICATVFPLI